MNKDINDLVKEISRRDRIITNLLCNMFAEKMVNQNYGYGKVVVEDVIKWINLEPSKLEEVCDHVQDRAISRTFNDVDVFKGTNVEKATMLSEELKPMLNGVFAKQLFNEILVAVDTKRIQLLKNQ